MLGIYVRKPGWFDEKYGREGVSPSINDVIELMFAECEDKARISERTSIRLERMLGQALYRFEKSPYKPSNEMLAHNLLLIACSFCGMKREKRQEYIGRYTAACDKHSDKRLFKRVIMSDEG